MIVCRIKLSEDYSPSPGGEGRDAGELFATEVRGAVCSEVRVRGVGRPSLKSF
jgi:hypothetical protein